MKKSGLPMMLGRGIGTEARTTASSGRAAWTGRRSVQTAVSVIGVHGADADA